MRYDCLVMHEYILMSDPNFCWIIGSGCGTLYTKLICMWIWQNCKTKVTKKNSKNEGTFHFITITTTWRIIDLHQVFNYHFKCNIFGTFLLFSRRLYPKDLSQAPNSGNLVKMTSSFMTSLYAGCPFWHESLHVSRLEPITKIYWFMD